MTPATLTIHRRWVVIYPRSGRMILDIGMPFEVLFTVRRNGEEVFP